MNDQPLIDAATRRLTAALEALDAAVDRRIEIEHSRPHLAEQVHALDADRSRLAADLDNQTARAHRLEAANRDIAQRLDAAMQNIQTVLEGKEQDGEP
jgi:Domain of unknown function (DUF4164)